MARGRWRAASRRQRRRSAPPPPVTETDKAGIIPDVAGNIDFDASIAALNQVIEELLAALPAALEGDDGFDVIANLLLANLPLNPNTYKETEHHGLAVIAEIAALAIIERGRRAAIGDRQPIIPDISHVNALIRELIMGVSMFDTLRALRDRNERGPLADLAHMLRSRDAYIRGPSFPHQEIAAIQGIFTSLDEALVEVVGFTAAQGLALVEGCTRGAVDQLTARALESKRHVKEITNVLRAPGQTRGRGQGKLARKRAMKTLGAWIWFGAGTTLSVTANSLAARAEVSMDQAQTFLELFATDIGSDVSPRDIIAHRNPLSARPLIHDGAGNYLCASFSNLMFALRPTLSERLLGSDHQQRFARNRARYLETAAVDALANALHPDTVLRNVKWSEGGAIYETDGLLLLDTAAIIVEAKSHPISAKARSMSRRLNDDLEEIIKEAADQAARLRDVIERDRILTIIRDNRSSERIELGNVQHIYCLTVALEDLTLLTTATQGLEARGLRERSSRQPLAMSLSSLDVICDLVEFPAQLLHYLARRARAHEQARFGTFEELDFFGYYLKRGLYKDSSDITPMWIPSMTDDMDAYYMWKSGERMDPAPKPTQDMDPDFRKLLGELEGKRPSTYITCSLRLLEGSREVRKLIVEQLQRLSTAADGNPHNASYTIEDELSCGITLMSVPPGQEEQLQRSLGAYVVARKYRQRLNEWFGIGLLQETPWEMTCYAGHVEVWGEDETLEGLASETLDPNAEMIQWRQPPEAES